MKKLLGQPLLLLLLLLLDVLLQLMEVLGGWGLQVGVGLGVS